MEELLLGQLGGAIALGFGLGSLFVYGLYRKRAFNSQDSSDLASALQKIEALEITVSELKEEVRPWRDMQRQFTQSALAEKLK